MDSATAGHLDDDDQRSRREQLGRCHQGLAAGLDRDDAVAVLKLDDPARAEERRHPSQSWNHGIVLIKSTGIEEHKSLRPMRAHQSLNCENL